MPQTSENLRAWFRRVEQIYPELFNAAHAMCGNYDMAEFALRTAILDVWSQNAGAMGFRERLRAAVRRDAFAVALSPEAEGAEFTWPGFQETDESDPIARQIVQERIEVQRALMLRFGCGLPLRSVARLLGLPHGQIRTSIQRFASRCRRNLPAQNRGRAEALIVQHVRQALSRNTAGVPNPAQIYRAFEKEASTAAPADHRVSRVVGRVMTLLLALICAVAFWLFAVIVQPTSAVNGSGVLPASVETTAATGETAATVESTESAP